MGSDSDEDTMSAGGIRKAIDALYLAFASTSRPRLHSSVPWRPDAEAVGSRPLRNVPAEVIDGFAFELGWLATIMAHQDAAGVLAPFRLAEDRAALEET